MNLIEQSYWQTINAQRALLGLPPINAAAAHDNDPMQRDSPLWNRLAIQTDDCGDGSGYETERYDVADGDWVCESCAAESVRERASEDRHNDPRTGQAADLNRGNF